MIITAADKISFLMVFILSLAVIRLLPVEHKTD